MFWSISLFQFFASNILQGNDPVAEATGLPLWSTETHITDNGGTDLISVLADGYMSQNLTSFSIWNAVAAYNPALFRCVLRV